MQLPCSGGIRVSKKAFLSMIGEDKFQKNITTSQSEAEIYEIISELESTEKNIVASRLGITKSSLKRKIKPKDSYPAAYDENFNYGPARNYLEKNSDKWNLVSFDPKKSRACLEIGPSKVKISVDVSLGAKFGST